MPRVEVIDTDFSTSSILEGTGLRVGTLTEAQREAVRTARSRHFSTAAALGFSDAATDPTPVYEPGSPAYERALQKTMEQQRRTRMRGWEQGAPTVGGDIRFEPEHGYIVEGEDFGVLVSSGMDPEQAERICSASRPKPRPVQPKAQPRTKPIDRTAGLGPVRRDAELRFGGI